MARPYEELRERLELARAQIKRVEREVRIAKQQVASAANVLANLEPEQGQEESNAAEDQVEGGVGR